MARKPAPVLASEASMTREYVTTMKVRQKRAERERIVAAQVAAKLAGEVYVGARVRYNDERPTGTVVAYHEVRQHLFGSPGQHWEVKWDNGFTMPDGSNFVYSAETLQVIG